MLTRHAKGLMFGALSGSVLLLAACGGASTPAAAPVATTAAVVAATAAPTVAAVATAVAPAVAAVAPTVASIATTVAAAVAAPATGQAVSFKTDIQPIFNTSCVSCHGANSGLSVASYANVMKGGSNAPDVKPGDADGSLLVQKVKGTQTIGGRMPRGGGPLSDADIKKISDWVAQGAKDN